MKKFTNEETLEKIRGGLIVSCQALPGEPLYTEEGGIMPLMAKAAEMSGAVGIRANSVRDITQIREAVDLPIIGIIKKEYEGCSLHITVTMAEVDALVECGTEVIAVEATCHPRPDGTSAVDFIRGIKEKYPDQLLMADCATVEEAEKAADAGADFIATTERGYTPETAGIDDVDFDFIRQVVALGKAKVIVEGHVHTPEQLKEALDAGAYTVVIGGAITRPAEITARFVKAIQ